MLHKSSIWFWIGVPVNKIRNSDFKLNIACEVNVFGFLIKWASSNMILLQIYCDKSCWSFLKTSYDIITTVFTVWGDLGWIISFIICLLYLIGVKILGFMNFWISFSQCRISDAGHTTNELELLRFPSITLIAIATNAWRLLPFEWQEDYSNTRHT